MGAPSGLSVFLRRRPRRWSLGLRPRLAGSLHRNRTSAERWKPRRGTACRSSAGGVELRSSRNRLQQDFAIAGGGRRHQERNLQVGRPELAIAQENPPQLGKAQRRDGYRGIRNHDDIRTYGSRQQWKNRGQSQRQDNRRANLR